ncbi:hypothetical protein D5086_007644 [Populus alba]|uniref:Uncharacterized protein n=1 Tax=Populus alba TaxID=43335 RepID=A0ACC4CPD3_POPAL
MNEDRFGLLWKEHGGYSQLTEEKWCLFQMNMAATRIHRKLYLSELKFGSSVIRVTAKEDLERSGKLEEKANRSKLQWFRAVAEYHADIQSICGPFCLRSITNPYSIAWDFYYMQPLASGYEVFFRNFWCYEVSGGNANPINKLADCPVKPQRMTCSGKIEKIRRAQQIQAMLAIRNSKQQLFVRQSCFQENQIPGHVEGADLEVGDLSTLASFDPNSLLSI